MDRILVGDSECSYVTVCNVIRDSEFAMHLYQDLGLLATELGVPPESRLKTVQQLTHGITSHRSILHDLLESWRANSANRATLGNLVTAVENLGLTELANALFMKFQRVAKRQRRSKYKTAPVDLSSFISMRSNIMILCSQVPTVTYERILENSLVTISDLKSDHDFLMLDSPSSQNQIIAVQTNNVGPLLQYSFQIGSKILLITTENYQILIQQYYNIIYAGSVSLFEETFTWADLTDEYKYELLHNCKYLEKIEQNLIENTLVGELLYDFIKNPPLSLGVCSIPEAINYYIPRRILSRNFISSDIFKIKSDHIFLFSGIKRHELSLLVDGKPTDTSSSQKSQTQLTVNFIYLETKLDYEAIASKTNRAVHWFHKENEILTWVQSTGGIYEIQRFVEEKSQKPLFDTEFLQKIEDYNLTDRKKFPVCISDTPGMGKTILLTQIASQLASREKLVIFIVIGEFLETLKNKWGKMIPSEKTGALIEILCSAFKNDLEIKIVEMNLKCDKSKVEILFDGLDEARSEDLLLMYDCFREINSWKSTRMWVTTRPHLLHALENELNVFGYNIAAFNEVDQHYFLERYWHHTNSQLLQEKLKQFAEKCLIVLKKNMTSKEKDIAGVPLQCLLIAEVFQQDAINYSTPENFLHTDPVIPSIQIKSIADLYRKLVQLKFKTYFDRYSIHGSQVQESDLENMHIHLSLLLLFPARVKTFNAFLKKNAKLTTEDVLKVGILESATVLPIPRFIHRTFAEYFIAVLVINVLKQGGVKRIPKFFLDEVLRNDNVWFEINSLTEWKMEVRSIKHKVISYFIDNMIPDINPNNTLIKLFQQKPEGTHLGYLFYALVYDNHLNIFNFFQEVYKFTSETSRFFIAPMVVYVAIHRCSLPFIKIVCDSFLWVQQGELHALLDNADFPCSVLDIAASRGSFEIVEYLVISQSFKAIIDKGKSRRLFHYILYQSKFDDGSITQDKVAILNFLLEYNNELLDQRFLDKAPLLCKNVHVKLLFEMINLNADLLAKDSDENTILHTTVDYLSCSDYFELFDKIRQHNLASLQKLVNMKTSTGCTPLHVIMENLDFDENVLTMFLEQGADFNTVDKKSNTLLATAVKSNRNLIFLKALVNMGAIINDSSGEHVPLLRTAIEVGNLDAVKLCIEFGFDLNEKLDKSKETPLHLALSRSSLDIADYLVSVGACINDRVCSLFHTAIQAGWQSLLRWLIRNKADVNYLDSDGNTPLHKLLKCSHKFEKTKLTQLLSMFIENKADLKIPNNNGSLPLTFALESGCNLNLDTLKLLEYNGPSLECCSSRECQRYLHIAINKGSLDVINWLIAKKIDVNFSDSDGDTPLHTLLDFSWRLKLSTAKILQKLLEHQADVNIKNKAGKSPLLNALDNRRELDLDTLELLERHGAVEGKVIASKVISVIILRKETLQNDAYFRVFITCIKNGADVSFERKYTLLFQAVKKGYMPGVKYLLLNGYDSKHLLLDTNSFSAASLYLNDECELEINCPLLQQGIYANGEPVDSVIIVHTVCVYGTVKTLEVLQKIDYFKAVFKDGALLFRAVKSSELETVKFLCDCYVNETGGSVMTLEGASNEKSLLHLAFKNRFWQTAIYLVKSHLLVSHLHEYRMRDLIHVCVKNTQFHKLDLIKDILEQLIKLDRSLLNETDKEGRTPLLCNGIHFDIIDWLINQGANKLAVDKEGNSVIDIASRYLWEEEFKKLRKLLQ